MKFLIVVDMQNDFITGALGTKEACAIVPNVVKLVTDFDGEVVYTRDTHHDEYLSTQEGKNLPVEHCIKGSWGWQICPELESVRNGLVIDKPTFGSVELQELLYEENEKEPIESIELIGLCTDICVISNAMLAKANFLEIPVTVDAKCCAGVTPEKHLAALETMRSCQICVD